MTSTVIDKIASHLRVQSGSCPNGHSLMSETKMFDGEKSVGLQVAHSGRQGMIYLNPFYGRFEYECEIPVKKGDLLEVSCPRCGVSLEVDTICQLCNIPMVAVHLTDGGQVELCPTIGCHNHALTIVDLDAQLARMYVDETKVKM
jgi:hypothetical protein